jgi:hypothetical protein
MKYLKETKMGEKGQIGQVTQATHGTTGLENALNDLPGGNIVSSLGHQIAGGSSPQASNLLGQAGQAASNVQGGEKGNVTPPSLGSSGTGAGSASGAGGPNIPPGIGNG